MWKRQYYLLDSVGMTSFDTVPSMADDDKMQCLKGQQLICLVHQSLLVKKTRPVQVIFQCQLHKDATHPVFKEHLIGAQYFLQGRLYSCLDCTLVKIKTKQGKGKCLDNIRQGYIYIYVSILIREHFCSPFFVFTSHNWQIQQLIIII